MVPLRGMRLESRIGRNWASRFPEALTVRLAETRPEYQQLLTKKKLDADFAETETEVDAEETEGRQLEAGDDVVDRILRED
jgi:restriction endonuclease Mrr